MEKTRNWTSEQLAIFEAGTSSSANLLIEALAGAAKTTTLTELAKRIAGSGNIISLAFNKKIAVEMEKKMPQGVKCSTLNSLGHSVWGQATGRRLNLGFNKMRHLTIEAIEAQPKVVQGEIYDDLPALNQFISGSKNHGHVPDSIAKRLGTKCTPLMTDDQFFEMLPEEPTGPQIDVILTVLRNSFELALNGTIDFADQLLLPTVMRCSFPTYSTVLVDEAQDLSELNHVMLTKLAKKRIIAVGDSLQAIYAFRGAHAEGMPLLRERFHMETLYLSTTFRCPENICAHVRWHAPRIESWAGNPNSPGVVATMASWDMDDIPDGAAVLCRNNAPLFRFALRMLKAGRRPNLWGKDVAVGLLKILDSLGAPNMNRLDTIQSLRRYQAEKGAKLKKQSAIDSLAERVECLLVFIEDAESLGGAIALAKEVFNHEGKVDLATGHKAKGAEWQKVFILDRHLLKDDGQDPNLAYVLATRAQATLTYLTTEGYIQ